MSEDLPPIVEIKAVNFMKWVMNEYTGTLEYRAVRHELQIRREGWSKNHWEALQVEEVEIKEDE
jgi:hypothetical protein